MKLNNKGQTLVMFVLLIPLLVLVLVLVCDIGNLVCTKIEVSNINKLVIDSGLDEIDNTYVKDKLSNLIVINDKEIKDYTIEINKNMIKVTLKKTAKSIFGRIIGLSGYEVSSEYEGRIDDGKKVIKKVK
mgnify:CR=1 FL=1